MPQMEGSFGGIPGAPRARSKCAKEFGMSAVMSSMRAAALASFCALAFLQPGFARADSIEFKPPNDPLGSIKTTNANDGYDDFRGDVFHVTADTTINSVGLFQNLTNISLNYRIWDIVSTTDAVNSGATLLRSGSANANTAGLEFIDFSIPDLTLQGGHNYHIEFGFLGNSNQNFYYNNADIPFTQGNFQLLDGTQNGNAANSLMPAIRINTLDAATTPLPSAAAGGLTLIATLTLARRRRAARI